MSLKCGRITLSLKCNSKNNVDKSGLRNCNNSSTAQELPASSEFVPEEISFGGSMTNPMFVSGQIDDGLRSCGEGTVET